jgi:hypothetical protein
MIDQEYKAWCGFQLCDLGLKVLPLHYPVERHCSCRGAWTCGSPAKHPACSTKDLGEQSDEDTFRMLREYPHHNLGVSLAGTRFVVLDVDRSCGGEQAIADFEARRRGPLPPTLAWPPATAVSTGTTACPITHRSAVTECGSCTVWTSKPPLDARRSAESKHSGR